MYVSIVALESSSETIFSTTNILYFAFDCLWHGTASYSTCKSFTGTKTHIGDIAPFLPWEITGFPFLKEGSYFKAPQEQRLRTIKISDSQSLVLPFFELPSCWKCVSFEGGTGWRHYLWQTDQDKSQDWFMKFTSVALAHVDRKYHQK